MSTVTFFDKFIENVGKGNIILGSHTFKVQLVFGYPFNNSDEELADIGSVEIPNGNGYITGGQALTGVTFGYISDGNTTWDASDVTWHALGGAIGPANGAVIYDDTSVGKKLVCYVDFGTTETAGDGTDFKVVFNTDGILTIAY